MPVSPPTHRPPGCKQREQWARTHLTDGKTTTERGYGWEWQKLRQQIIKRDKGLCQMCLTMGKISQGTEVDHIKSKSVGGTDDANNLQLLCTSCHRTKTATIDSKGRAGQK